MQSKKIPFIAELIVETGTDAKLTTDKAITDAPTQYIDADVKLKKGEITEIKYRINPTAAETYALVITEGIGAAAYEIAARVLYASAALLVDDTEYKWPAETHDYTGTTGKPFKPIPFVLDTDGRFYIATDWTGAPGNTIGFIIIKGFMYA